MCPWGSSPTWRRRGRWRQPVCRGSEIELIVFGTCSHDDQVPNMASGVQARIGAQGCRRHGHQHGLHQFSLRSVHGYGADQNRRREQLRWSSARELISPFMDWTDRDVAVLFGDGAAAVVSAGDADEEGLLAEKLGCYGEARETLRVHGMGGRYANRGIHYGAVRWQFEGQEIFKRAVQGMGVAAECSAARASGSKPPARSIW